MSYPIGTIHHTLCVICGNQTVDEDGHCHYAYCDEMAYALNDQQPEFEWPDDDYENSLLDAEPDPYYPTVSESLGMDGYTDAELADMMED